MAFVFATDHGFDVSLTFEIKVTRIFVLSHTPPQTTCMWWTIRKESFEPQPLHYGIILLAPVTTDYS